MLRALPVLLAASVLLASAFAPRASADPANAPATARRVGTLTLGEAPPPLRLTRVAGTEAISLDELRGQVVVLDFWATWCVPCRAVMPYLDDLYRRHRGRGLSVVGLSAESDSVVRAHLASSPVEYTLARDDGSTMQGYGIRALPTLVVIDRAGRVREVIVGLDSGSFSRLDSLVTQLLAQPAPPGVRRR